MGGNVQGFQAPQGFKLFLSETGPGGKFIEHGVVDSAGLSLGVLFRDLKIDAVWVNHRPLSDWRSYVPVRGDHVNVYGEVGWQFIPVIIAIISTILSLTVFAPKKPKATGNPGASYGITGFQNTTGQGTPILRAYGLNRIYPHVIASGIDLVDQRDMVGKVLYCVGASDDYGWEELSDVLINDVPAIQYEGMQVHYRLGIPGQPVIPGFEDSSNVWDVNVELPYDEQSGIGTAINYATKATDVNLIKVILSFPGGLWRMTEKGKRREDNIDLSVYISIHDANAFQRVRPPNYRRSPANSDWWRYSEFIQSTFYDAIMIDTSQTNTQARDRYWNDYSDVATSPYYGRNNPEGAWSHYNDVGREEGRIWHSEFSAGSQYDVRLIVEHAHQGAFNESHNVTVSWFETEERTYTSRTYPNRVMLGLTNIPAKQVSSLQSLKVSVLAKGQKVKIPDGQGNYSISYSRQRCWNVRHFLTDKRIGMGYEVDEGEISDSQWLNDAQNYYDELVPAQDGGTEPRDLCDWLITERRWDWEHVKSCVSEGRGVLFPSGGFWKWVVDKPGTPQLLFSEPGNVVEGSITMEIAPPDRPWNQIIAEFRDENDSYRPGITQPINGPDVPYPSMIQEAVTFDTITRESHALRECMVMLKRQFLEKRRWTFTSPQSAIVKEPLDLDWLSERTLGAEGACTGFLPAGSTTSTISLDREISIDGVSTYILIVQHRDGSTAETRTVTTGAGNWMQVSVSSPFSQLPAEGDIYAIGKQNVDHIVTRLRDMTIDNEGRVQQIRSEYIEEVYDPDPLPPSINRKIFPYGSELPPIPLRDASVTNQLVQNRDGSWRTVILFDVTPGLVKVATTNTGGVWPYIFIDTDALPSNLWYQMDYFKGAYWQLTTGESAGAVSKRRILQYSVTGSGWGTYDRRLILEGSSPPGTITGEKCTITWDKFGEYDGFSVEQSPDNVSYSQLAKFKGLHGEIDGGDQQGFWYFRFTPFNPGSSENKTAQIIKSITLIADTSPPAPAILLTMGSQYKTVSMDVTLQRPLAEDLSALEYELWRFENGVVTTGLKSGRVGFNVDTQTTGQFTTRFSVNLNDGSYGWEIWGRIRTMDYTGNVSAWMGTQNIVTLSQVYTPDLADSSVVLQHYFNNQADMVIGTTAETEVARISITTEGYPIQFGGRVSLSGAFGGGGAGTAEVHLMLRDAVDNNLLDDVVGFEGGLINLRGIYAVEGRAPGTYEFYLTTSAPGGYTSGNYHVFDRQMSAIEIKR